MARPIHPDGRVHGVIIGCRRSDGRWLLIRRAHEIEAAPSRVCFPGGAVELDEAPEAAAVREMREELGVEVTLLGRVWHHAFEDKPLTLWGWLGRLDSFDLKPDPAEVAETLWLTPDEAANHPDTLPRTDQFIEALLDAAATHVSPPR